MGGYALSAVLASLGTTDCASKAALPSHVPCSTNMVAPVRRLRLAKVSPSFTFRSCRAGRLEVREGRHRNPEISVEARLGISSQ